MAKTEKVLKRVAIVGFGFMGRMHYGNWKKVKGAKAPAKTNPKEDRAAKKPKVKEAGRPEHGKKGKE